MVKKQGEELVIVKKEDVSSSPKEDVSNTPKEEVLSSVKEGLSIVAAGEVSQSNVTSDEDEFIPPEGDEDYIEEDIVDDSDDNVITTSDNSEPKEEITIVPTNQATKGSKEIKNFKQVPVLKKVDIIKAVETAAKNAGIDTDKLSDEEDGIIDNLIDNTKISDSTPKAKSHTVVKKKATQNVDVETALEAKNLLSKFKDYITSTKFDKVCETSAKKHGVKKCIVKNRMIAGFLGSIANILGLTFTIAGDVIMSAVNFIAFIINKILEFAIDNVKKLITLLTLNCGEIM